MRKSIVIILAAAMVIALAACETGELSSAPVLRPGTGNQNNQTSVSDILDEATKKSGSPAPSQPQPDDTAPPASQSPEENTTSALGDGTAVDLDLTKLSSLMVYTEVSNIMYKADRYLGKTVRMRGTAISSYSELTDTVYYAVIIADATACCAQGFEYQLRDGIAYPEDGREVTVTGVVELYNELGLTYLRLGNAVLSKE